MTAPQTPIAPPWLIELCGSDPQRFDELREWLTGLVDPWQLDGSPTLREARIRLLSGLFDAVLEDEGRLRTPSRTLPTPAMPDPIPDEWNEPTADTYARGVATVTQRALLAYFTDHGIGRADWPPMLFHVLDRVCELLGSRSGAVWADDDGMIPDTPTPNATTLEAVSRVLLGRRDASMAQSPRDEWPSILRALAADLGEAARIEESVARFEAARAGGESAK